MFRFVFRVGKFYCRLNTENKKWYEKLSRQYQAFIVPKRRKSVSFYFNLRVSAVAKNVSMTLSKNGGEIVSPTSLIFFKRVNFYLKTGVAAFLLKKGGCLLHASSFANAKGGHVFVGKQNAGKSTIVKLAAKIKGVRPLNDDFTLVDIVNNKAWVFSTPFLETNPINKSPQRKLLKAMYLIKKSDRVSLDRASKHEIMLGIYPRILSQLSLSSVKYINRKDVQRNMWRVASRLANNVLCYKLYFKKDRSFYKLIN